MQQLESLEHALVDIAKGLPHLPKGLRDWLATNMWWLAIVTAIACVISALMSLVAMSVGSIGVALYSGLRFGGMVFVVSLIMFLTMVAIAVINAMAVAPLQSKRKRGWSLVFLGVLVGFAGSLITDIITLNVGGAIASVVWTAIALYVVFEIRDYFLKPTTTTAK